MHWISMKEKLPIHWPWSMKGFATIREPGCPPRVIHGEFNPGRCIYQWETDPKPYMVKSKYRWPEHLNPSRYEVVFCEETDKNEDGVNYWVYPQPWIVAWMPDPAPYREDLQEGFEVEVNGNKYFVEIPELEMTPERMQKSESELYELAQFWTKACERDFKEHLRSD